MVPLKLDYRYLQPDVTSDQVKAWQDLVDLADHKVVAGGGRGSDFLGWVDPSRMVTDAEHAYIKQLSDDIRNHSEALVVIGIGGSYLGARAVVEALAVGDGPEIIFAGNSLSADYHEKVLRRLDGKKYSINVISKSGTTTEPAVAFRLFRDHLEKQVGKDELKKRIVATTDSSKGALKKFADEEGYPTLRVPDEVGGRYSVLTAVGLLPIAVAGIDIDSLRAGAQAVADSSKTTDVTKNPAAFYAAARNLLYHQGYSVEILSSFEPRLHYFAEWWKQLFGESEGKDHAALFPASVDFTSDLHSMGQWIQQGRRFITETFLVIDRGESELSIPKGNDLDELGYLAGKPITYVNTAAYTGVSLAHREGGVPNQTIHLDSLTPFGLGSLIYFFERACGISGYLLGVNPFDQPGVEAYKKNMFAVLGKPGWETASATVNATLAAQTNSTIIEF
jgi:glucose-6-phosphate isomerase